MEMDKEIETDTNTEIDIEKEKEKQIDMETETEAERIIEIQINIESIWRVDEVRSYQERENNILKNVLCNWVSLQTPLRTR